MLWIFSLVSFFTSTPNYALIRQTYQKAISNHNEVSKLTSLTVPFKNSDPIAKAFYASAQAFEAKNATWVSTKVKFAKNAHNHLNISVSQAPNNVEIRFLRFSFEYNTPSILGMKNHITEDKAFLLKNTKSTEPLWTIMQSFYQSCSDLTAAEKESILKR
jgi:hypothetical protein